MPGAGGNFSDQGPQSPQLDRQSKMAEQSGVAFEVFSINDQGQRKRHQVWRDRTRAYHHLAQLKKLYGTDIKAGIREVRDMSGNLYSQSVKKCQELLGKAAPHQPPVTPKKVGIVTGGAGGKVMTGKSPKVSGHISGKMQLGTTKSGKTIHNDPGHEAHSQFSAADHMDAYRAHAGQLSKLDPKDTHPSIIEHHKQSLNTHFKQGSGGVGMKKSFSQVVGDCRTLLKAGEELGKTRSGKSVMAGGNSSTKGWSKHDHIDAMKQHHSAHLHHFGKLMEMKQKHGMDTHTAHQKIPGFAHASHMNDHHAHQWDKHYHAAMKLGASKEELTKHLAG